MGKGARFFGLPDFVLVVAFGLLVAAVLIPRQYFMRKAANERNAMAALRYLAETQKLFTMGQIRTQFANRFADLKMFSNQPAYDSVFNGEYSGYTFNIGAIPRRELPRWLMDQNLVLARFADFNALIGVSENPDWNFSHSFRMAALATAASRGDQNVLLSAGDTNSVLVAGLNVWPLGILPPADEMIVPPPSPTPDPDLNAVDTNSTFVQPISVRDVFVGKLTALTSDPRPVKDYLDLNFQLLNRPGWSSAAWPVSYGTSGVRSFYIDESGAVRGMDNQGKAGGFGLKKLE